MQVEISVQDRFQNRVDPGTHPQSEGLESMAVSSETWEIWFRHWLEILSPTDAEDGLPLHPEENYELSLRLTDDREIQALNNQYRHKNQPTDVLAFATLEVDYPQSLEFEESPLYLGDIVISIETAQQQAIQQGHSLQIELAWLAAHGLLHLLGWDHPDDELLSRMLDQQQSLLQSVGLSAQVG
ncbi:MAG: rRNA maturation RNase YbeY [Leptolyngbyaceae cyanobacterium SU_3_3]|nr:rRNA maturation RNase YbeY [Leptolyngbyaceae cyanobacterium SU_3_3]NJR51189.1 rRNA maturation RNase YbeY [Leptolyngbyaceae cyanobacterium CSU_1_3]